jgi:hypothetical protein
VAASLADRQSEPLKMDMRPLAKTGLEFLPLGFGCMTTSDPAVIVPVPDMLRFLTYAEGHRQSAMARERYLELPENVRRIRCHDCSSSSVLCPNGVAVRDRLTGVQTLFA